MRILVTGVAGFIGMHLAKRLLELGNEVVGIDNINTYYDIQLKIDRLSLIDQYPHFSFWQYDVANATELNQVFSAHSFDYVVHLAAQAGVRYSLEHPEAYVQSNLVGFVNILEACRHHQVRHLVYASSSSVYGGREKTPFSEDDPCDHPISLYAATKKSNELTAHVYSHLFHLPTTGLRFFTVYGPWSRPDMAIYKFAQAILDNQPIEVYNNGDLWRDFTYIDDIIEAMLSVIDQPPTSQPDLDHDTLSPACSWAPYQILNIGHAEPVMVNEMIDILEKQIGKKAIRIPCPMQPGDVKSTHCDNEKLIKVTGKGASTSLEAGIQGFIDWFVPYHEKRKLYGVTESKDTPLLN